MRSEKNNKVPKDSEFKNYSINRVELDENRKIKNIVSLDATEQRLKFASAMKEEKRQIEERNIVADKELLEQSDPKNFHLNPEELAEKLNLEQSGAITNITKLECNIAAATLKVLQANRELAEFKNALVKEYEVQNIKLNNVI